MVAEPSPPINWEEVREAADAAGAMRNHFRSFDRIEKVLSVVNRSQYLMQEAEKQQRAAEGALRERRDELNRLTDDVAKLRANKDAEIAKINADLKTAREKSSEDMRTWSGKLAQVQSEFKAAGLAYAAQTEKAAKEAKERRDALQLAHQTQVNALAAEIESLKQERTAVQNGLDALRNQARALVK